MNMPWGYQKSHSLCKSQSVGNRLSFRIIEVSMLRTNLIDWMITMAEEESSQISSLT